MKKESNIFDPIQGKLDQKIFRGTTPRAAVIKFINKTIFNALDKEFEFDASKYLNLYLTGSLTTYQYHETSDVDINIFVDYNKWPQKDTTEAIRKSIVQVTLEKVDGTLVPGTQHPLQIFVLPEGIEPRENFDVGLRSAWNFKKKEWLIKPEKDRVLDVLNDTTDIYTKAMRVAEQMEQLLDTNPNQAKKLYKRLRKKRQQDQKMFGDFSEGNIIYKFLDYAGLFDKLRNIDVRIAQIVSEADNRTPQERWRDIEEKAKRYIDEQRFYDIHINNEDNRLIVNGRCIGERKMDKKRIPQEGDYACFIELMEPNSNVLSNWGCDCPWGQVSWGRSRRWKKYEGRPCTHVLGLYWIHAQLPREYRVELEKLLEEVGPQQAEQVVEQEITQQWDFKTNNVVRIKPQQAVEVFNPRTGEVVLLKQGTRGVVIDYDPNTGQVYVSFDFDQGTYFDPKTFEPIWIDQNLLSVVQGKTGLPIRGTKVIEIKEAQYVPRIVETT